MKKDNPDRAARLAEALRTNLRRRKTQAREQVGSVAESIEPSAEGQACGTDGNG